MGNFSLDPNARAADALAKHYIAVRQQQAVPLLDADWNLLEDLRRSEHESLGQWFIGSGVPAGDDGFSIFPAGLPNDFGIRHGLCLVSGKLTVNDADTRYSTQPNFGNPNLVPPLPALTTPAANKGFFVYLDVWEREVDSQADPSLVDVRIGVESAIRLKRDWSVRVARIPEDLPLLDSPPAGHLFLRLAQINRIGGDPTITAPMIVDLRETQLSVRRRIEVRDAGGVIVVEDQRFRLMLESTRNNLVAFVQYITTQFNSLFSTLTAGEIVGLGTASHIAHTAEAGLALVNSRNLANPGALSYLSQLYTAEQSFMTTWRDVVLQLGGTVKNRGYQNFITRLNDRLNSPVVGPLTGLLPALQAGDLAAATAMQEEIARLFGAATASIARGSIQVFLANSPPGILTNGQIARFEFGVRSFTTQADSYSVSILPAAGWPRLLVDSSGNPIPNNKVAIGPSGTTTPLLLNVTVQAGSSDLQLRVTSDSNPAEIDQLSSLFTLTQGAPAPLGENKVQFRIESPFHATIDPATGAVKVSRPPAPQPASIVIRVFNVTGQNASFQLSAAIVAATRVGTWTVNYTGNATEPINNGASAAEGIDITAGADAVSMEILFTAVVNLGGPVTATFRIPVQAS